MPRMLSAKPRVLYICGWGRSGSTVIDRILGEVPGFVSVGELRSLWDASPSRQRCGCGELVTDCPLWGPLLHALFAASGTTWESVRDLRDQTSRSRDVIGLWRAARRHLDASSPAARQYGDILTGTYGAVLQSTRSAIVVDSSKHPPEAMLLAARPDIDLTVLHLVRDPRGVAYSWRRRSDSVRVDAGHSGDRLRERSPLSSSSWWTVWNVMAESMLRPVLGSSYVSLRYEDIMRAPRRLLGQVVQQLGSSPGDLPFTTDEDVVLGSSHTVAGNPNRMGTGAVRLEADRAWETSMGGSDRLLATLPALPMLGHFKYGVRTHRAEHTVSNDGGLQLPT